MLRLLAFTLFMTVGLVASVWSRFAALLMYVWFALFRPQEWVFTDVSALRLSLILGLLLIGPSLLTGVFPNLTHPLTIGAAVLVLLSLVAQLTTPLQGNGWAWLDLFARLVIVSCFAVSLLNTRRRIVLFIAMVAVSLGFHSTKAGIAFLLGGGLTFMEGLGGSYVDNNGYAMAIAMTMPLMLAASQNLRFGWPLERWVRYGFLVALPLSALTIIGTKSRSGFLSLITLVLLSVALHRRRFTSFAVVGMVCLLAYAFVPLPPGWFDRMETIRTYEEVGEESALSRLHFWQVAVRMVADNPLGVGPRNFDAMYHRYDFLGGQFGTNRSVHSSHFQVLAEIGYAGFAVWVLLFVYAFWVALRLRRYARSAPGLADDDRHFFFTTSNALIVSMAAFLVGGSFIALALNDLTWYTFAMVAAVDRLATRREAAVVPEATTTVPAVSAFERRAARA